jgi:hypothetical protein
VLTEIFLISARALPAGELDKAMRPRFYRLNNAISRLLDDYCMVSFFPLDISDEAGAIEHKHSTEVESMTRAHASV